MLTHNQHYKKLWRLVRLATLYLVCIFICLNFLINVYADIISTESTSLNKSQNILANIDGLRKNTRGITYSCQDGSVHISGTPTKSSYIDLLGSVNEIPTELKQGYKI